MNNGWSHPDQYTFSDGQASTAYRINRVGVFYENLSYANYVSLRKELRKSNASNTNFNLDDATAIMKVKGPDGKYVLEGAENWFSMTMFDNTISNKKLEKILDILDWLLSEEGTRFAVYGIENFDYTMVNGQPVLIEENWPQNPDGNYLNNYHHRILDNYKEKEIDIEDSFNSNKANYFLLLFNKKPHIF